MNMSGTNFWNPNLSDDEEESEDHTTFGGRDGVVFLIDCAVSMFENQEERFRSCLDGLEATMKNRIISSEKDMIGVVFYNTEHSPPPKDESDLETDLIVPHQTCIFMPMQPSSAKTIKYVKHFKESSDLFDFNNKYGHSAGTNFAEVLWLCSRMFTRCGYKLQQKTIILCTDNEEPHPAGSHELQQTFIRAKDLRLLKVDVNLIIMTEQFDAEPFYKEFLCSVNDIDADEFQLSSGKETLLNRVFRRDSKQRCINHINLQLGENLELAVCLFSLLRSTTYPKPLTLHRDTNEIIVSKRSYFMGLRNEETDEIEYNDYLHPGEQRKIQKCGGENISFSVAEVAGMKQLLPSGIKLLGFKPRSKISIQYSLRKPLFIFPDEERIKGSTKLFRALWEKCLEKEKVAIGFITLRRKTPPKLVALVPQRTITDDNFSTISHNGFRVEFLPYAADIRNLDFPEDDTAEELPSEGMEIFQKIIGKLKFRYEQSLFENPIIRTIYSNIESHLFDTVETRFEDKTLPNTDLQDGQVQPFIEQLTEIFGSDLNIAQKRGATRENSRTAKIPKTTGESPNAEEISNAVRNGNGDQYSVAILKGYLQDFGISGLSKLKKSQLIDRIKEHLSI